MATVITQANATGQLGNFANQLGIPPSYNSTLQQPGPQAAAHPPAFPTSPNMVNAENGKREAQKGRSMKKVFRAFGPRRGVPLKQMPKEPTFRQHLEAVVLITQQNAGLLDCNYAS
jgi:hypothetical protein